MANAYDYCVVNYHSIDIIHLCNSFISSLFRYDANWLVWFIAFHMPKWWRTMHDAVSPFSLFAAHGKTWSSKHSIHIERQMQFNMSTSVTPIDIRPLKREYSNTDCVNIYFGINANIEHFGVVRPTACHHQRVPQRFTRRRCWYAVIIIRRKLSSHLLVASRIGIDFIQSFVWCFARLRASASDEVAKGRTRS